jgi:CheY-like chemotaxis protein
LGIRHSFVIRHWDFVIKGLSMPPLLLLVDDAPEMAHIVRLLARRSGQELVCKTDAASVLTWLNGPGARKPDLLLLDLHLPGLGGIDLYRYLKRQTKSLENVPAALFTQGASASQLARALDAQIDFLVSKELLANPEAWKERISEVLDLAAHPPETMLLPKADRIQPQALAQGLQRVLAHPILSRLEEEGTLAIWRRARIRLAQELSISDYSIDVEATCGTLMRKLLPLASSQPDVVVRLLFAFEYQLECLLGRAGSEPVRTALAACGLT